MTAHYSAADCYGIVDLVSRRLTDSLVELFNKQPAGKGVKVETVNNKIYLELYVDCGKRRRRETLMEKY